MIDRRHVKALAILVLAVSALVAGCGNDEDAAPTPPNPDPAALPLMVDSLGRQVPEQEFGRGDAAAAGADGIVVDGGPLINTDVVLSDNAGRTRAATTDSAGYFRLDIKGLTPPFVLKARRFGSGNWFSASMQAPKARAFVTINVNGLSDKTLSYVADAVHVGDGASAAVTPVLLAANPNALAEARTRLRTGLRIPLLNAGLEPSLYDPVADAFQAKADDKRYAFLAGLLIHKTGSLDAGKTAVVGTIAGAGGYVTNGPAARATFSLPSGMAVDASGNLFVADTNNNLIRKITPAGDVSTFAGTGLPGYINGSPGTAAFDSPQGLALDAGGNLYVADTGNNVVRKLDPSGNATVLAGGGGLAGLADGKGTAARFSSPRGVAVDGSGNVFVADHGNNAVRKITPDGVVTTVAAGNQLAPRGVAVDRQGNVYFSHSGVTVNASNGIRKITPAGVVSQVLITTVGFADANRWSAYGLAVDADGTVYATDASTHRVFKVPASGTWSVLAGAPGYPWFPGLTDGRGSTARFSAPAGIALDGKGNLFIADAGNNAVRKLTAAGEASTVAGKSAGFADGTAGAATFDHPTGVAIEASGAIVVADTGNHAIRRISATGAVTTVAGSGTAGFANGNGRAASFNAPTGVAADGSGNIYVAGNGNLIRRITAAGDVSTFAGSGAAGAANGPALQASFNAPAHVAADRNGNVYVSDTGNALIRKISAGTVSTVAFAHPPENPFDLEVGPITMHPGGIVYFEGSCSLVQFSQPSCIYNIAADGVVRLVPPSTFITNRRGGLAVDTHSDVYSIYTDLFGEDPAAPVGDTVFKQSGTTMSAAAIDPRLSRGRGMAIDGNGNLVLVDSGNSTIKIVLP